MDLIEQMKRDIVDDLADYHMMGEAEVLERFKGATADLNAEWAAFFQSRELTPENIKAFYLISEDVAWETAAYNYNQLSYSRLQMFALHARGPILDFGGGIGTDIFLCYGMSHHDLTYIDLGKTREFALWRFHRHDIAVRHEMDGEYDTVIMSEVLEHLTDWPIYIDAIMAASSPKATWIVRVPWNYNPADDPHLFHPVIPDTDMMGRVSKARPDISMVIL